MYDEHSPQARKPMRDEDERGHEEEKHSGAIFRVSINFPRHPH